MLKKDKILGCVIAIRNCANGINKASSGQFTLEILELLKLVKKIEDDLVAMVNEAPAVPLTREQKVDQWYKEHGMTRGGDTDGGTGTGK